MNISAFVIEEGSDFKNSRVNTVGTLTFNLSLGSFFLGVFFSFFLFLVGNKTKIICFPLGVEAAH